MPYSRRIWEHETTQDTLYFFGRTWRFCVDMVERFEAWNRARRERESSSNEEPPRQNTRRPHDGAWQGNSGHGHDEAMRREQARREAEARARREQAERERQNANKPRPNTDDEPRDPEAVLGLKAGYTDEDLRTAYKREAGRTHPDKWIGKPEAIRQLMEAEYKAIQEAYRILQNRKP
jgi:DnaJ domain